MMLKLLFVGDGPRDEAAVPFLVGGILNAPVTAEYDAWKDLHLRGSGRGLGRKLLYTIRRAKDRGALGVVATVDSDKREKSGKLSDLQAAREKDRAAGNALPVALGEAIPHLEAWLLDDGVAVRKALGMPSHTQIEAPTKVKSPKEELNRLHENCGINRTVLETLAAIASELSKDRCSRAQQTGFHEFIQDIATEFGPLCQNTTKGGA